MPISDRQQQTLVRLAGYVTQEFLDRAKLALRVYGIPYGDLGAGNNVSELYRAIERYSATFVEHDAISLLQFMLQMVGVNADKVNELGSDKKCLEACRKRSKFSELVFCLCAELSEEDYIHLKSLACEHVDVASEAIVSRTDLFHRCISQEVLRKDDIEFRQFKEWLGTLGRNDLVSTINAYISEKSRSKQAIAADSNSPDGTLEPAHIYSVGAPSNLLSYSWFHANITRGEAEKRLRSVDFACFLIRPSERFKESLTLSLKNDQGRIFHHRIIRGTGWYVIENTFSHQSTVPELVSYFKTHSVTDDPKHKLCIPCPKVADSAAVSLTSPNGLKMGSDTTNHGSQEAQGEVQVPPLPVISNPTLTWREAAEMHVAMSHPQVVRMDNKLYTGGGFTNDELTAKLIVVFDIKEQAWSTYCMGPTIEFGLTQLNGKLVAVGGVEDGKDNDSPSNKVFVFDKKWDDSQIRPFMTARFYAAAFSYESNLIVAGGGVKMVGETIVPTTSVEVYHGATGQWNSAVDLPLSKQSPGSALSTFVSKDRAYLLYYDQCMSINLSSLVGEPQSTSQNQSKSKVQTTDLLSSWKVLTCPLKCSAIAVVDEKLIAIGGRRDGKIKGVVHVFEPDTNSWGVLENGDLPESRYHATIAQIDSGRIIIIGGDKRGPDGSLIIAKTCYVGSLY